MCGILSAFNPLSFSIFSDMVQYLPHQFVHLDLYHIFSINFNAEQWDFNLIIKVTLSFILREAFTIAQQLQTDSFVCLLNAWALWFPRNLSWKIAQFLQTLFHILNMENLTVFSGLSYLRKVSYIGFKNDASM